MALKHKQVSSTKTAEFNCLAASLHLKIDTSSASPWYSGTVNIGKNI